MSTKHTPGPWTNTNAHMHSHYIHAPGHRQMYFLGGSSDMPQDEQEANARLIAAAPDLLEALEKWDEIREWLEMDPYIKGYLSVEFDEIAKIQYVIAKAKGEDA